ncbi:hypothetical protein J0J30_24190, partial [Vibrio vulnificus]|nr:hypothetical protein [Vibrio vulnificus]
MIEERISAFLQKYGKRAPQKRLYSKVKDELKLDSADDSDRGRILNLIQNWEKEEFSTPSEAASQLVFD